MSVMLVRCHCPSMFVYLYIPGYLQQLHDADHGCVNLHSNCTCSPFFCFCRLAYPTPPAGADPETWVPEEEPQPIGISISLPQGSILPSTNLQAAFWDHKHSLWSTADMSSVTVSDDFGIVAFQSKAIGCLAVVQKRTGLLPYQEWHVRPAGGRSGAQAMVGLQTGMHPSSLFELE